MMTTYEIKCRAMAEASLFVNAETEEEAEKYLDNFLQKYSPEDLDWEAGFIDDVEIVKTDNNVQTINDKLEE